jgi:hypothetical protein
MTLRSQEINKAYSRYCALCATTTATNRQVTLAWNKYQRLLKQSQEILDVDDYWAARRKEQAAQIEQVGLDLPVLYSWVGDNPGPEWRDKFVGTVSGNVHIVMSRNNKYDGHVDWFVLSHDNYFANVLTANKGRIAVNTSDYTRNGFNDVTIAVGLTAISLLLGLQP